MMTGKQFVVAAGVTHPGLAMIFELLVPLVQEDALLEAAKICRKDDGLALLAAGKIEALAKTLVDRKSPLPLTPESSCSEPG